MEILIIILSHASISAGAIWLFTRQTRSEIRASSKPQVTKKDLLSLHTIIQEQNEKLSEHFNTSNRANKHEPAIKNKEAERIALAHFHGLLSSWTHQLFAIDIHQIKVMSANDIQQLRLSIDSHATLSKALSSLKLTVGDQEVVQASQEMLQTTLEYKSQITNVLVNLEFALEEKKALDQQFSLQQSKDYPKDQHPQLASITRETDRMIKKINDLCDNYWQQGRANFYQPVRDLDEQYIQVLRQYLIN